MPISEIKYGASGLVLNTVCIECGVDQVIEASALTLGMQARAESIALPPCVCGAKEFLQRTTDIHPVDSQAGHRKTVNALAEHLKAKGLIHPNHVDAVAAMTPPPQIGPLVCVVPESSLPPLIVHMRRQRRAASAQAPDAVAAAKAVLEAAKAAYEKAVGAAGGAAS